MEPPDCSDQLTVPTLKSLLADPIPPAVGFGEPQRRLGIAAHVFDTWTAKGSRPANLADRYLIQLEAFFFNSILLFDPYEKPGVRKTIAVKRAMRSCGCSKRPAFSGIQQPYKWYLKVGSPE